MSFALGSLSGVFFQGPFSSFSHSLLFSPHFFSGPMPNLMGSPFSFVPPPAPLEGIMHVHASPMRAAPMPLM